MVARSQGIVLKKKYGQHFLRDQSVVDHMLDAVALTPTTSVFEIGCGDGFLTKSILQTDIARLWIFEIDPEWAGYVKKQFPDPRLTMFEQNILDADLSSMLGPNKPWTLLSNLPYQVTFPILHLLQKNRDLLTEGVVMVQEEVAQKLLKTGGRDYGFSSLFFQHYFEWKMLDKVPPAAFVPPPKVYSRLLYFKPRVTEYIPDEDDFWKFIKIAFRQPRRTLRNNLAQSTIDLTKIPDDVLNLRAQQMNKDELLKMWNAINAGM